MLVVTASSVAVVKGAGCREPQPILSAGGTRRAAEGASVHVVVLEGGTVVLLGSPGGPRRYETGIAEPVESVLITAEAPLTCLLGTEGSHLFRFCEEGGTTERLTAFDRLECRDQWYTPWGGPAAVRSMALTPDGWVYADVHVGSIMRSSDLGQTWEAVTPTLHEDVHEVATSPAAPDRVYANTAKAVYTSDDRGQTWAHRGAGLDARYGRAMAVHPDDPDCLFATVSDGPHGDNVHGQLFRSDNGGASWLLMDNGFPGSVAHNIDTYHAIFTSDGWAWAALGPHLYRSGDRGGCWKRWWSAPEAIVMLAYRRGV